MKISLLSLLAMLMTYLLLWPTQVEPVAWQAPINEGYVEPFSANQQLSQSHRIELNGDVGPEDYALDDKGNIYFSLLNGDIKFLDTKGKIQAWVNTGGRPLGMEFDQQGNLIVADAYIGLLKISKDKKIEVLLDEVEASEK